MSFPRAKITRFNESTSDTPAPTRYNPRMPAPSSSKVLAFEYPHHNNTLAADRQQCPSSYRNRQVMDKVKNILTAEMKNSSCEASKRIRSMRQSLENNRRKVKLLEEELAQTAARAELEKNQLEQQNHSLEVAVEKLREALELAIGDAKAEEHQLDVTVKEIVVRSEQLSAEESQLLESGNSMIQFLEFEEECENGALLHVP